MNRIKIAFTALFAALLFTFAPVPATMSAQDEGENELTSEQSQILGRVNGYFNNLEHLRGRFTQIGPNGEFSEGLFFLERPGKIRFEYNQPHPLLIVADGSWVGIEDRDLRTTDKYPLSATPLNLLLEEYVDLNEETRIIDIREEEGFISVTFEDDSGKASGQLTLILGGEDLALRQWIVLDAQGLRTEVSVFDLVAGVPVDPKMFWIRDNAAIDVGNN